MTHNFLRKALVAGSILIAPQVFAGTHVLCSQNAKINLMDVKIGKVIGSVERFESLNMFQGWASPSVVKTVGGVKKTFVKVELTDRSEEDGEVSVGYVDRSLIKLKADCAGYKEPSQKEDDDEAKKVDTGSKVSGLNDKDCCLYPLKRRAFNSLTSGAARFGARRSGGRRLHAGVDFYTNNGEPIRAIAPGKVIQNVYKFYQGTYALEVKHAGGFVVRYGEINGKVARGVSGGRTVAMGQALGNVKKTRCCTPMLHFEMYSGSRSGSLSGGGKYRRRSDLINPTSHVVRWEQKTF